MYSTYDGYNMSNNGAVQQPAAKKLMAPWLQRKDVVQGLRDTGHLARISQVQLGGTQLPMTDPNGAGRKMLTWLGVYWWDKCSHIYSIHGSYGLWKDGLVEIEGWQTHSLVGWNMLEP